MVALLPRRTERIPLRRPVHLLYRGTEPGMSLVNAEIDDVNIHGVGVAADKEIPDGSKVYVFDREANVGVWGSLKWKATHSRDGRRAMGVEFEQPGVYWLADPVPSSWKQFLSFVTGPSEARAFSAAG